MLKVNFESFNFFNHLHVLLLDIEFDIDEFDSMLYDKNGSNGVCNTDDQNTSSIVSLSVVSPRTGCTGY